MLCSGKTFLTARALLALTLVLVPAGAFAETPQKAVEQLLESIKKIKAEGEVSASQRKANRGHSDRALAQLDIKEVSRKALGRYWSKRTLDEQKDFITLLSNLFITEAFPNSSKFFAALKIVYGKTRMKDNRATVPLTVIHEDEGEIEIDFHMKSNSSNWRVVDVDLDGISMRNNLRSQFYKIIGKHDFKELFRRMDTKLKKSSGEGGS
ncbi:MAG: ABC transporter substrate-binding protein [Nitrospinaceae bacterium]